VAEPVPTLGAVGVGVAALADDVPAAPADPDCVVEPRLVPVELLEAAEVDGAVGAEAVPELPSPWRALAVLGVLELLERAAPEL
jgi:hypothetical protein